MSKSSVIGRSHAADSATTSVYYVDLDPDVEKPGPGDVKLQTVYISGADEELLSSITAIAGAHGDSWLQSIAATVRPQIIVSVASGTRNAQSFFDTVLQPLLHQLGLYDGNYDVHHTTSDQSIIELVRKQILPAAQNGHDQAIVLLSGDGGMIDIINVLYEQPQTTSYRAPAVAILPLGSGNALANSSKAGNDSTFGLRPLLSGAPRALPTFKVTLSPGARHVTNEGQDEVSLPAEEGQPVTYGAVVVSWGFHASLVADSDTVEYRKHGAARFQMAAKEALFPADGSPPHAYRGAVKIIPAESDGLSFQPLQDSEYAYVLATYMSQLEAGFTISPSSAPLDGKLYLIDFGALGGNEIMSIMQGAYQGGKHVDDPRVHYREIDGLRIEINEDDARWRRVCIDGKIIRVEKNGWVEVRKNKLSAVNLIAGQS